LNQAVTYMYSWKFMEAMDKCPDCWGVHVSLCPLKGNFTYLTMHILIMQGKNENDVSSDGRLSVRARLVWLLVSTRILVQTSVVLCADSPLRTDLLPKASSSSKKVVSSKATTKRQPIHDQPLTFHTKVKSSGYTTQPRDALYSIVIILVLNCPSLQEQNVCSRYWS